MTVSGGKRKNTLMRSSEMTLSITSVDAATQEASAGLLTAPRRRCFVVGRNVLPFPFFRAEEIIRLDRLEEI